MVIDIDSFLDQYEQKKKTENKTVGLDFQKDIEERLSKIQKDVVNKDIEFLKQVYDEVKSFDEDLPNKFLGIEAKGSSALGNLGEKYSVDFLKISKNNAISITNKIIASFKILDENLANKDFANALNTYKSIIDDMSFFPKTIIKEKIAINSEIRNFEMKINLLLKEYKAKKIVMIRNDLISGLSKLKEFLIKGTIAQIESQIVQLNNMINSIPKVLASDLLDEKIKMSQALQKAEQILVEKYEKEFEYKTKLIDDLSESFHSNYISKNLNEVLLIYNEILEIFKSMPDVLLEKKIEIYKKVNKLFEMTNQLIINRNVLLFIESYEYGKRIEAIREYLRHLEVARIYPVDRLTELNEKVKHLPNRYSLEKDEFIEKIEKLLLMAKIPSKLESRKTRVINNELKLNSVSSKILNSNAKQEVLTQNLNVNFDESLISDNLQINVIEANSKKNKILKEIDNLYRELKITPDTQRVKQLYKKIMFYLNMVELNPVAKKEVAKKINLTLSQKKLS